MNLENVVLVRAMNNIPFDGILMPSCKGKYLKKEGLSDFKDIIRSIVKKEIEKILGRQLNLWEENDEKYFENIVSDFYPYTSSYTSTLSFSLNGMTPDDINNKFSSMNIAVIEPLKYHQDKDFVTVDVIDTTIKGEMNLSKEAIMVIKEDVFVSLSFDEQKNLMNNYKIEIFNGNLKDSVEEVLKKYNYPVLPLVQDKSKNDILECNEKEEMLKFQDEFANIVQASRLKLQFLYTNPINLLYGIDKDVAPKVQSDFKKNLTVEKYYKEQLYMHLLKKTEENGYILTEEDRYYLFSEYNDSRDVLENIVSYLYNIYGINGIKQIILEFNQMIIDNYITNEEIINLQSEGRKQ